MSNHFLMIITLISFVLSLSASAQWVQTEGPTRAYVRCLAVGPTGTGRSHVFAGTSDGVLLSTSDGAHWSEVSNGIDVSALAVSDTNLLAGSYLGHSMLSTNNGTSWSAIKLDSADFVSVCFASNGTDLFAATPGRVLLSTNNGTSWTSTTNSVPSEITCLAAKGSEVYAGTVFFGGGVYRSTNRGESWSVVNAGLTNQNVLSLAINDAHLFAGTWGGGVFLSTNSGAMWTPANTGMTNTTVLDFAVGGTNLFAGTEGGVFHSTDNGKTWANVGVTSLSVSALAVSGPHLIAGGQTLNGETYSGAIWRRSLSEMITSVQAIPAGEIPRGYTLEQNYPNPFNPSTTIRFDIPVSGLVSLKVYDIVGREISVLVNEELPAGRHEATFDAGRLAGGMYYYQLTSGEFISTRTLLLVR